MKYSYLVWLSVLAKWPRAFHWMWPPMVLFQEEKPQKLAFSAYYSKAKTEECNQNNLCFSDDFGRFIPWTTTYFLEVSARVSAKVATNGSFRGKRTSKNRIFEAIIRKQKRRSTTKVIYAFLWFWNVQSFSNYIISGSECTCFSQSSYQGSFRGKWTSKISIFKAIILKQKRRSATKEIYIFVLILERLYLEKVHIFWEWVHAFHWK